MEALTEVYLPSYEYPNLYNDVARARPTLKEIYFWEQSELDDECIAAICNHLSLEKLYLWNLNCDALTSAVVDIILRGPTAQSLSEACIMDLPAIAPVDVLRLARGCPRLTILDYSLDPVESDDESDEHRVLSVADQSHVDNLVALLESRCREANIPPKYQIHVLEVKRCKL